jgi:hypothetical protein
MIILWLALLSAPGIALAEGPFSHPDKSLATRETEYSTQTRSVHIADPTDHRLSNTIGTAGGRLTSLSGDTIVTLPAGALTDTIITHTPAYGPPPGGNLAGIGHTST